MKNKFWVLLALLLFAAACNEPQNQQEEQEEISKIPEEKAQAASDSLSYRYVHLERKHPGCKDLPKGDEGNCTQALITYVEVTNAPGDIVQKRINDSLIQHIIADDSIHSLDALLDNFIAEYEMFLKDMKELYEEEDVDDDFVPSWSWEINQKVVNNRPEVFVVEESLYSYQGGAHGSYASVYLNFSPRTGKLLHLQDLISPNHMTAFMQVAKKHFDRAISEEALTEEDFWFPEEGFYVPEVFGLLPEGMTFVYGIYEIAPYAAGEITFTIPYKELQALARPYSVLARLSE